MTLTALGQIHPERPIQVGGGPFRIPGIREDGVGQLLRRAGKTREEEDAGLLDVLRGESGAARRSLRSNRSRCARVVQAISDVRFRQQIDWSRRVCLELLPKLDHIDTKIGSLSLALGSPNLVE